MHILFVTHYYEPDSGAAAVRLTRLAKRLHARGHQVTILTTMPHFPTGSIASTYRGRFTTDELRDGIRVVQVWLFVRPKMRLLVRLLSQISFMLGCALRGTTLPRPDVMLVENQPLFTALAGWYLAKLKRCPTVVNVSDYWPEYLLVTNTLSEHSLLYRAYTALVNVTQRDATAIIAMLPPMEEAIIKRIGPVTKLKINFNAADTDKFHPEVDPSPLKNHLNLPSNKKIVTFVGTFATHIDLAAMINVVHHLRHRDDVYFLFVGGGGNNYALEQYLQGEPTHIRWLEWQPSDRIPMVWAMSYCTFWMVHDSWIMRGAVQGKTFEALASGTPVLVGARGLIADLIRDSEAGFATPPSNVLQMANAIIGLLDDPDRRQRMSENARIYAETHFNPVKQTEAYETVLQDVVNTD